MPNESEGRRVVVAACAAEEAALRNLFADRALSGWDATLTHGLERARFCLQHAPYDLLIVDEALCRSNGDEGLSWLARQNELPVIALSGGGAEASALAYERGATLCLPRQDVMAYPPLLAAALRRAALAADFQRKHHRTCDGLAQARRQIDRLVGLLWRAAPVEPGTHWCTQRHVLERLEEELARAGRHGGELTVALGEIEAPEVRDEEPEMGPWLRDRLGQVKRRCDVAGQYGLRGFILLLVETSKEGGVRCCERLQQALEARREDEQGPSGPIQIAFGLESLSSETATPQSLLSRAERHLDAARAGAAGRIVAGC